MVLHPLRPAVSTFGLEGLRQGQDRDPHWIFSPRTQRVLLALAIVAIVAQPLVFFGTFAGDAQLHLVFAENAARGRFYEFNPGERVSGETSPGYMLLGAALFRLISPFAVPLALKLIDLAVWYTFCLLVYQVAKRALVAASAPEDRFWAVVAALTAALIPGSVYNANVGMENGLFAALIWLWLDLVGRWNWLEPARLSGDTTPRLGREIVLSALLGISCWFRPEGFVVLLLGYAFRWWVHPPKRTWILGLTIAAIVGLASVAFQIAYTGDLIATSILSRHVLTMRRSLPLGPLALDPAFAERLVFYLPLTACFILGLRAWRDSRPRIERFLLVLLGLFFLIYTCLTGSAQLARYVIFLMPILAIGAARGARALLERRQTYVRWLLAIATIVFFITDVGESWYRRRQFSQHLLLSAMTAPEQRRWRTDALLHDLGDPTKRPVILALEAVQMRYELDERVTIRSLDGRVDRELLEFVRDGSVDHIGYIKSRGVDYLFKPPPYNRNPREWSLAKLGNLKHGERLTHDGLGFRRLPSDVFVVER